MSLVKIVSVYVTPSLLPLNLIFPGVCFNTVLLHSHHNCGMNLTVIESEKGGTACRLYCCVYLHSVAIILLAQKVFLT